MHSALKVAHCLLDMARRDGKGLTPMQMLKLVYICHGWMLGLYRRPLIWNEVQAWKYGPVIPDLYQYVKGFRSNQISNLTPVNERDLDHIEANLVGQVYEIYGELDGIALSHMTHKPGTPWAQTYHASSWARVISNDLIQAHYARLSTQAADRASA